jgi:hypothetical protein
MRPSKHFERWIQNNELEDKVLCHFYVKKNTKQYFGNPEFAYFNLVNSSPGWIVGGTTGHGVTSDAGECSQVPCLNCFSVDDLFCTKLISEISNYQNKYEIGIILDRSRLENTFSIHNVGTCYGYKPLAECHKFDNPKYRKGVLDPFNYCQVIRMEIPKDRKFGRPIVVLDAKDILAVLLRPGQENRVSKLLIRKQMQNTEIFAALR